MRERQRSVICEVSVQRRCWIICCAQCSRSKQHDGSPRSDRKPYKGKKNDRGPEESYERAIRIHKPRGLLLLDIRKRLPTCNRLRAREASADGPRFLRFVPKA